MTKGIIVELNISILFTVPAEKKICFNLIVQTMQYGSDTQWQVGVCNSFDITYSDNEKYIKRCCLELGLHTLTCTNKRNPYGWGDGYIEIQGHRYCNDFMSFRLMNRITIRSNDICLPYSKLS